MRHIKIFRSLLFLAFVLAPIVAVTAQESIDGPMAGPNRPRDFRTNALRQLGLSRDQLQRIRRLNRERAPLINTAQMRLREANRALDESIYSDNASDSEFQARLKDFQMAQAEVVKIRFMHEFGVRQILTREQLMRFRQIRRRFEESRMPADRNAIRPAETRLNKQRPEPTFVKQNSLKPRF